MKHFKRILSLLLTVIMLVSCVSLSSVISRAETEGKCGDNLTWRFSPASGVLTITGTGEMYDYDYNMDTPWDSNRLNIRKVVIENGVTHIGSLFLYGCQNVTTVEVPESVKSVGYAPFEYCGSLAAVNVNENNPYMTSVDGVLFDMVNKALVVYPAQINEAEYHIPDFVEIIKEYAFYENLYIQKLTMSDNVKTVGEWAFRDMAELREVELSDNIKEMPFHCMSFCYKLEKIKLPADLKVIGDYSLSGNSIKEIELPYGVEHLGYYALSGLDITTLSIPDTLKTTGMGTFAYCRNLTDVKIGKGLTAINSEDFLECTSLKSIVIPENIVKIDGWAFEGCTALENIEITDKTVYVGNHAFGNTLFYNTKSNWDGDELYLDNILLRYNGDSKTFTIPSFVRVIGGGAFSNLENLVRVDIHDNVKGIGEYAFYKCTSLNDVSFPEGIEYIEFYTFYDCTSLNSFSIPDSVKGVASYAFYNTGIYKNKSNWSDDILSINGHLISVNKEVNGTFKIEEGIKSVSGHAFAYSKGVTDIVFPDSVKVIMNNAFISGIKRIYIPPTVEIIEDLAFTWDVTIVCYKDSNAHKAALKNGWSVELICTEHIFTNYIDDNNATCSKNGTKTAYCDNGCGTSDTVEIENTALGHSFTNYVVITELSCTVNGVREALCDNGCGEKDIMTEEAQGHLPGEWVVTEEPDYYNDGCKLQKCTVCAKVLNTGTVAMLPYEGFPDVWENSWYAEGVEHCFKHGYIMGADKGIFDPNGKLTREQFVVIFARIAGAQLSEYTDSKFTDVKADSWYGPSVIWASENGYINGVGNGKFGSGQPVYREQLAVMLYRYAEKQGMNISQKADLSYCADAESISNWARDACAWAIKEKLLGSTSETENFLSPKITVTRAQAAKIFLSYDAYANK